MHHFLFYVLINYNSDSNLNRMRKDSQDGQTLHHFFVSKSHMKELGFKKVGYAASMFSTNNLKERMQI